MPIQSLPSAELPPSEGVQSARNLFKPENQLDDKKIYIREMVINAVPGEEGFTHGEDIAVIRAQEDTPVQHFTGDGTITEIMFDCVKIAPEQNEESTRTEPERMPVGVILMSPEGEIFKYVYDPLTDGGPRSYSITKGWRMQTIVLRGTELRFYDHWAPRGFCNPGDEKRYYGYEALPEETDPVILRKFSKARSEIMDHIKDLL